jgi:hypothetical protein
MKKHGPTSKGEREEIGGEGGSERNKSGVRVHSHSLRGDSGRNEIKSMCVFTSHFPCFWRRSRTRRASTKNSVVKEFQCFLF